MRYLILSLVLVMSVPTFSQSSGILGLYVNDNTDEFVCFGNDSVWFRINSHSGYNILLFGKGKVEREQDGRLHILCDKQLIFHTAAIASFPRKDDDITIQGYYRNGDPIPYASCRLVSDGKTHYGMLDMEGIYVLDEKQAKCFCSKETKIEIQDITLKARFHAVLKEGHDYVITSLLPEDLVSFPYSDDTLRARLDFATPSTLFFSLWDGDYGVFREPSRLSKTKTVFKPSNILFYSTTKEMVCGKGINEGEMVTVVETAPIFGRDLNSFITDNIHYPFSAIKDSIEGTAYVEFYIDTVGGTFNHRVLRGIRGDLDEEALRVARLLRFDAPAKQQGKPIIIQYFVPVRFVLNRKEDISSCSSDLIIQSSETREVFGQEPKQLPYYEGGYEKMYEFLFSNIDLSDIDSSAFDGRKIFVGFTIDTMGNTYDHRILNGSTGKRSDDALINACKLLHFHPAIGYDDKPQNYEFSIAIQFGHEQNDRNKCFFKRIFKKKSR